MSKSPKEPSDKSKDIKVVKDDEVVDQLLSDLGVDDQMKHELLESGRMQSDVVKVESADQVRRRIEIEKASERQRDSLHLLERNIMTIDGSIDRLERDLVPVVLSFLVGLKGDLVGLRESIVGRSKRRSKTNLQSTFVDTEVKAVVEEEFARIEETLTTGMSMPVLEKVRILTEDLNDSVKITQEELTNLKAAIDNYAQRSSTEVEFLSKELALKPKVEVPKEVSEQIKAYQREIEELNRDLTLSEQKLENRESAITELQNEIEEVKSLNDDLEKSIAELRASPAMDTAALAELRQQVKSLEATRDLLTGRMKEEENRANEAEAIIKEHLGEIAKKDLEIGDLAKRVDHLQEEMSKDSARLAEMEELRARIRSYESGDKIRELERVKTEIDRLNASYERLTQDFESTKKRLEATERTLDGYMGLMKSTEKTKAFLMLEDVSDLSLKEIGRSLGVSPAIVRQWADDFVRLGIAEIIDDQKLAIVHRRPRDEESTT